MGKASSAKKVARAAGLGGGRAYGSRPAWNYYFAVLVLLVLGVVGVYNAREYRMAKINAAGTVPPTVGQTPPWFEGLAVEACGKLLPPVKSNHNPYGLYTKGDGIIYISPTKKSVAGHNATLFNFASGIGMKLNAGALQVPGGHLYQDGDTCEGKPGHVYVMTWSSPQAPASDGVLQNKHLVDPTKGYVDTCNPDCNSGVLLENDQLVTIAFLPAPPKGKTLSVLEPPPSVIRHLTDLVATGGTTTTTTPVPPTTSKTTPSSTSGPSTTLGKGGSHTKSSTSSTSTPSTSTSSSSASSTTTGTTAKGGGKTTATTAKSSSGTGTKGSSTKSTK
jgi:hypothetical protein